jgi:two-component system chemotaxis response regulator CheB
MAERDIIAIGASAGGVAGMQAVFRALPRDLPAAVFAVLHIGPYGSGLASVLSPPGGLRAEFARDGERIEAGRIYVAPPDRHMLAHDGHVELSRGPRENRTRPAIDPLFRTVASAFGERVVAVLLSGYQGDGTVGLMAVRGRGGLTVVQDPDETEYGEMPSRAIRYADVHRVMPLAAIGPLLASLARDGEDAPPRIAMQTEGEDRPRRDLAAQSRGERSNDVSTYSCPDCGGVLWQLAQLGMPAFRCHVGHAYAQETLHAAMSEQIETALWSAVRALTERSVLARQRAGQLAANGPSAAADDLLEQAEADDLHLRMIRDHVLRTLSAGVPTHTDGLESRDDG